MEKSDKNKSKLQKYFHQRIIIDNSLLIKLFLKEEGRESVKELLKMALKRDLSLFATPLLIFEFLNVLSKSLKDSKKVQLAYNQFKKFNISLIEPTEKTMQMAIEYSCSNQSISYYDASYSALAQDLEATFLTADKKYYELMKHRGNIALLC